MCLADVIQAARNEVTMGNRKVYKVEQILSKIL